MGGETFDLRPSRSGGWDVVGRAFGRKLRSVQAAGPAWCVALSLVDEHRNLYSQAFVQRDEPIYAEVVSDRFLEGLGGPLSTEQHAALTAGGWTDTAVPDDGRSWPNWYRYFSGPCREDEAANAMVFALAVILGVEGSELVRLRVFPAASGEEKKEDVA